MSAVRSPGRHRRRLHEVSAGRTEGAHNSISLVQPPHRAVPETDTPPCAFAHRLFPAFRRCCPGPALIGNLPFHRGLRFPADNWGTSTIVCGRSTFWSENAVPDPPDWQPCPTAGISQERHVPGPVPEDGGRRRRRPSDFQAEQRCRALPAEAKRRLHGGVRVPSRSRPPRLLKRSLQGTCPEPLLRTGGKTLDTHGNNADAAASRVGCCSVGSRPDVVESGVQPRVTWRARGSPGGGSAWWRSADGSP